MAKHTTSSSLVRSCKYKGVITINKQKIEELKNQYQQALDSINTEEDLKSLLDTTIKFNKYPFDNIVLILNQNPDAEFLATIDV